jgi:ADP-ribose pyrophosphatase
MPLPPLPRHTLAVLDEELAPPLDQASFLRVRRQKVVLHFADGAKSEPFGYDSIDRERMDAVVVVPHFKGSDGKRWVYLRSAVRPPVAVRPEAVRPIPEKPTLGNLWEVVAGLVEVDERSPDGLRACAVRELLEEVGFSVTPPSIRDLGPSSFPAPGIIGERHFFFQIEVDPAARVAPTEDGSALERCAVIAAVSLDEALELCRAGEIEDAKTELSLRRLAEL